MYKAKMSLGFALTKTTNRSKPIEKWPDIFILLLSFHGIKFHEYYFHVWKAKHETKQQITHKLMKESS